MPKGTFTDPRQYGSDKPVRVRALRRMNYKGETKMPKEIFEVPDWQVKWWMTFPDPGVAIVGGGHEPSPSEPEAGDATSTVEKTDEPRTKSKFRRKRRSR